MRARRLSAVGVVLLSFCAVADDGHNNHNNNNQNNNNQNNGNGSFQSSVVGSTPGAAVGGVSSGGAPWVVNQGDASFSTEGRIRVQLQGLLIAPGGPPNLVGTTGPVAMVGATLVCGGSGGTPVPVPDISVTPTPLSSSGNAEINQAVTLPGVCFGPVVVVRIFNASAPLGSQLGAFIAVTGMALNQNQNQNQNQNGDGHDN
jgi:hypothetical protein